ncbi:hypothetical protein pb186bvf_018468 [Paramecium bursaria]
MEDINNQDAEDDNQMCSKSRNIKFIQKYVFPKMELIVQKCNKNLADIQEFQEVFSNPSFYQCNDLHKIEEMFKFIDDRMNIVYELYKELPIIINQYYNRSSETYRAAVLKQINNLIQ